MLKIGIERYEHHVVALKSDRDAIDGALRYRSVPFRTAYPYSCKMPI